MKFRLLFALIAGLIAGCSNSGSSDKPVDKNFGVVNFTYDTPNKQDLGNGKTCVFTAKRLSGNTCELLVSLEKSGKVIDSRRVIPATFDQPAEFGFQNAHVTITPHLAQ